MADPITELSQHLSALYNNPDPDVKSQANEWLQSFQKTQEAWITADLILNSPDAPLPSKLFAAQTFRAKITFDLDQLSPTHRLQLRDSLLTALTTSALGSAKVILVQLCLSLADLALQLPEWPSVVSDMTDRFGQNPETVPVLLEFLTVLPQEVMGNSRIRITNSWSSPEVSQLISNTLSMYLGATGITNPIKSQIFTCLSAWLRAGEVTTSAVASPFILGCVFNALTEDALFESAVDLIVDLIHETQEIDDNMPLIERIVPCLIALKPKLLEDRDDPDKMRGYCRIYVEAGEWYTPLILRHPETFLPVVQAIRLCCDHDDLEVVAITFNFWYRLSKGLHRQREDGNVRPLLDIYSSLVATIVRHLHYPDDLSTHVGQESEDFRRFRHEIGDTLKDCCYVLGASTCLKRSYDMIVEAMGNTAGVKWQDIEAPLFSMRTMGAEVDPRDGDVLPLIMDLIPKLPAHPKIRYATILVLCRYTEWTNLHPAGIPFQLQYISSGFEDPSEEVRLAAAQAMKYLCRDCAEHLVSYLPQLHTFYSNMSAVLGHDDMNEVCAAIAHIITAMPPSEATQTMTMFCMPLIESLHTVASENLAPTKQIYQNICNILDRLETFLAIIQKLDRLPDECSKTAEQVWKVLESILSLYSTNLEMSDKVCKVIRRGLNFFGTMCVPILSQVLEQITVAFSGGGCPSFMWVTAKIVNLVGQSKEGLDGLESPVKAAFERQSAQVISWVDSTGAEAIQDVIEDYIHLLATLIEHYPQMLLISTTFQASFRVVMASLEQLNLGPLFATLEYVREILGHPSLDRSTQNGVNAPAAPAGFTLMAESIRKLINEYGFKMTEILVRRLLTDYPEDSVSTVTIIIRLISEHFPIEISNWIPSIIEQLPSKIASIPERQKFVLEFEQATRQGRSDLVKESILSLVKASRRERARERFNDNR